MFDLWENQLTEQETEALIAMLAAARLGAVWSSCSPDFGVQGVLDRFGQIEPKVLIAQDGYVHAGKMIDRRDILFFYFY